MNEYLSKVIDEVVKKSTSSEDTEDSASVTIPKRDTKTVEEAYRSIPDSASSESHAGKFVNHSQYTIGVILEILQ